VKTKQNNIPIVFAVCVLFIAQMIVAQEATQKENINYKWSFVARGEFGSKKRVAAISRDTSLKSGDEFKLLVHQIQRSYVYVIYKNSKNEITMLFPYSFDMFEKEYALEKNYYIPKGRDWFKLDKNIGTETFYILASSERLTDLESGLKEMNSAANDKKLESANMVINEIRDIKKRFRTFSTLAERPVSIAGNVRGKKDTEIDPEKIDIATMATEISANNFYSKTITIDHK